MAICKDSLSSLLPLLHRKKETDKSAEHGLQSAASSLHLVFVQALDSLFPFFLSLQIVEDTSRSVEHTLQWAGDLLYRDTRVPTEGPAKPELYPSSKEMTELASTSARVQERIHREKAEGRPGAKGVLWEIAHSKALLVKAAIQGCVWGREYSDLVG